MFDKDGGGSISTDEIKQVLSFGQNLDEEVIQQIIKQVDENGDGEISYDEFAAMMLKNISEWSEHWVWDRSYMHEQLIMTLCKIKFVSEQMGNK